MRVVLFVSARDDAVSQMAAALFNKMANAALAKAISAGIEPTEVIDPRVIEVLREADIDVSHARPQILTERLQSEADILIKLGSNDWPFTSASLASLEDCRETRDRLRQRVWKLIAKEGCWKLQAVSAFAH